MLIQGPLRFSVAQEELASGYELFVDFQPDFCALPLEQQSTSFRDYLQEVAQLIAQAADDRTLQGLFIVQQLAEQLLPYIESGDLELEETINIHVRPDSPEFFLVDLLKQH
jgi:hypothetical protein